MRYIDKSTHRTAGLDATNDYLSRFCVDPSGRFSNPRYDTRDEEKVAGRTKFCVADGGSIRDRMIDVLLANQQSLCCYCLRRLGNPCDYTAEDKVSIEHIIPRGYNSANPDVGYYRRAPGLGPEEVEMLDIYDSPGYVQQSHIHPHNVAYNNFVASCNGSFSRFAAYDVMSGKSCNTARIRKLAYPIYFHPEVVDWVKYDDDGYVRPADDVPLHKEIHELIKNTKLNNGTLKAIRRLWYILRNEDIADIEAAVNSTDERRKLLSKNIFKQEHIDDKLINLYSNFMLDYNFRMFWRYSAFHDIMRQQHN